MAGWFCSRSSDRRAVSQRVSFGTISRHCASTSAIPSPPRGRNTGNQNIPRRGSPAKCGYEILEKVGSASPLPDRRLPPFLLGRLACWVSETGDKDAHQNSERRSASSRGNFGVDGNPIGTSRCVLQDTLQPVTRRCARPQWPFRCASWFLRSRPARGISAMLPDGRRVCRESQWLDLDRAGPSELGSDRLARLSFECCSAGLV